MTAAAPAPSIPASAASSDGEGDGEGAPRLPRQAFFYNSGVMVLAEADASQRSVWMAYLASARDSYRELAENHAAAPGGTASAVCILTLLNES